ncbi:MAG: hypothetical protein MJH10_13865 [Epibacterium sp.]|nr:hypothetical protein [Epibacterium sp.]NQX74616.1 hypothetical protein [Epibacterium sp.]
MVFETRSALLKSLKQCPLEFKAEGAPLDAFGMLNKSASLSQSVKLQERKFGKKKTLLKKD